MNQLTICTVAQRLDSWLCQASSHKLTRSHGFNSKEDPFLLTGASQRVVATAFGVSHVLVANTIERFTTTASFDSKPRTGWLSAFTWREKRYIVQLAKRDIRFTHKQLLKVLDRKVSCLIVRRVLREHNYWKWRVMKRIPLTVSVVKDRYVFVCYWSKYIEDLLRVS